MTWNCFSRRRQNSLALILALWVGLPVSGVAGSVLSVSVETDERPPQALRGVFAPPEGEGAEGAESAPARVAHENRLDQMDVYALSPAAVHLRLPRMVPPEAFRQTRTYGFGSSDQGNQDAPFPDWTDFIHRAARDFDVDAALIAAVIQTESAFSVRAVSAKGAQGLMQLMPATGASLGLVDPFDPEANIRAGTRYLKAQLSRFPDIREALAAYNAGPGNVLKYGGVPPFAETREFVRRVLAHRGAEKPP
jgi:soluble lytic murein transglycosylase-like protein